VNVFPDALILVHSWSRRPSNGAPTARGHPLSPRGGVRHFWRPMPVPPDPTAGESLG